MPFEEGQHFLADLHRVRFQGKVLKPLTGRVLKETLVVFIIG